MSASGFPSISDYTFTGTRHVSTIAIKHPGFGEHELTFVTLAEVYAEQSSRGDTDLPIVVKGVLFNYCTRSASVDRRSYLGECRACYLFSLAGAVQVCNLFCQLTYSDLIHHHRFCTLLNQGSVLQGTSGGRLLGAADVEKELVGQIGEL